MGEVFRAAAALTGVATWLYESLEENKCYVEVRSINPLAHPKSVPKWPPHSGHFGCVYISTAPSKLILQDFGVQARGVHHQGNLDYYAEGVRLPAKIHLGILKESLQKSWFG